jgi:excisionase family DNA binding protein
MAPFWVFLTMAKTTPGSIVAQLKLRHSLISSTEVMEILGVSRNTLCAWVSTQKIPAVRIGKVNKFDPILLAQWIEERQTA